MTVRVPNAYPGWAGVTPARSHGMMNEGDALQICENVRLGSSSSDQHSIVVVALCVSSIDSQLCLVDDVST